MEDFAAIVKSDKQTAWKMLQELSQHDIGSFDGEISEFDDGDKLKATIFAISKGIPIDDAAEHIDWRDFEGLTAQILQMNDFATIRNLILTKPRMEIDVVGVKFGVAILIDCKHWRRHSQSALDTAVQNQIKRTKHYVASNGTVAAPVIVTLYQDAVTFIDKVPIVPIFRLESFLEEFYGNLENVETIRKDSQ